MQNSYLKLIFIVHNLDRSINDNTEKTKLLIVYTSDDRFICLND